jgi:hypothetical protein
MEHKEFAVIFGVMCEYFGATPSDGLTEIYYQDLKGLSTPEFKKAFSILRSGRVYNGLPKIAEIKEAIQGKLEDKVAIAYQTLTDTLRDHGYYDTVIFEDGAIGKTVETMGGWFEISQWTIEEWKFRKKEFDSLYLANLRAGNTTPIKLIGVFERENAAKGLEKDIPKAINIGTPKRVLELK